MGVTLVTFVTFILNIIVMCHWSPNVSQVSSYDRLSMMSGGRGVKKCFLGLRRTALLSAEGKKSLFSAHVERLHLRSERK
jgi:hypothetical protein